MGISLAEAEAATRIRQKYLTALEADEWHLLPGEVVGRGFLRNYATFLGLEPNEVIERRRAVTDDRLAAVLAPTSAGSSLPPMRNVDYRPREVDLREEEESMETRELRLGPLLAILGVLLLAFLLWSLRAPLLTFSLAAADSIQSLFERAPAQVELQPAPADAAIVNPENLGASEPTASDATGSAAPPAETSGGEGNAPAAGQEQSASGTNANLAILIPTSTPTSTPASAPPAADAPPAQEAPAEAVPPLPAEPTATPTTEALIPLPTPTEVPLLLPTPTPAPVEVVPAEEPAAAPAAEAPPEEAPPEEAPEPEAPPVVAAACPDPRALIASPGVNQVLTGVVPIIGTADHEALQYYKLEYAPGANAGGGFVYFDGGEAPIVNGILGNFNSGALPNGTYTLQIVVVDQTGNFPPPCSVTVEIAN